MQGPPNDPTHEPPMPQMTLDHLYINGTWCAPLSQRRIEVVNPATERVMGTIPAGTAADVDRAVAAARAAFPMFSATSRDARLALLGRILDGLEERAEALAQVVSQEMGCAISFARDRQVPAGAAHIRCAMEALRDYRFLRDTGGTAIAREAIGVCGLITPWNWPIYQITAKVGPALAAGCTMVLKPSELSPFSAQMVAEILHDAGVPAGVFNMVHGAGAEVGEAMSRHPDIDMISITGSTRAGAAVAVAAAATVKRVTQELGGKSPNILLEDADFAAAVPPGVLAAFRNVGQSCSAPTRMLVPEGRVPEVEALVRRTVGALVVGDPADPGTDLGPVANRAQFERVQQMIARGIEEGARLICGGLGRPEGLATGYFVRPTVFSDVQPRMAICQQEIFGPVLCIQSYRTEAEAVTLANDTVFGLGAQIQSRSAENARRVALQIRAGQVHINYPAWDGMAPFGGYKQSGNGREYGVFGLEDYLETKAILGYS
jgi:aldehyde dehydrogenase (NAD+)